MNEEQVTARKSRMPGVGMLCGGTNPLKVSITNLYDTDTVLACRRFETRRYFQNASKDRLETNKGQEVASKK